MPNQESIYAANIPSNSEPEEKVTATLSKSLEALSEASFDIIRRTAKLRDDYLGSEPETNTISVSLDQTKGEQPLFTQWTNIIEETTTNVRKAIANLNGF